MSALPLDDDLGIEPITGWRVWKLMRDSRGRLLLASIHHSAEWPPGEPLHASCRVNKHAPPSKACSCGIYAASSVATLATAGVVELGAVIGTLAMWGRIVEHATGARAELAYPSRLRLRCMRCAKDPTVVAVNDDEMEPFCAGHGLHVTGGLSAADVQAELLATYAVDLLPRPVIVRPPPDPERHRKLAGKILVGIGSVIANVVGAIFALWAIAGFVFVGVALVWTLVTGALRAVGLMEDEPAPVAAAVSVPDPFEPLAFPRAMPRGFRGGPHPQPEPPPRIRVAIVCGVPDGAAIRQVPCDEDVVLMGFADDFGAGSSPSHCSPEAVSFSRTPRWRVCWYASGDARVDVPDRTTTTNPFRGGP